MNKRVINCSRSVATILALILTISATTGCRSVTPQMGAGDGKADVVMATDPIPILVTLAATEGEALATTRTRVMARLRPAMSAAAFAAIRTYETLPIVALDATPEIVALLLTLPSVRSVEADRSLKSF